MKIEDEEIKEIDNFRFLDIRCNSSLEITSQLHYLIGKFNSSTVLAHTLKDFGCNSQLRVIIMSYTQGAFNHGINVARPLSISEASKLQLKLNKSLRIIYKIRPKKRPKKKTKVYLSQARMLKICKIRSLIHVQKKLGVTLITKIIQKPCLGYYLLIYEDRGRKFEKKKSYIFNVWPLLSPVVVSLQLSSRVFIFAD